MMKRGLQGRLFVMVMAISVIPLALLSVVGYLAMGQTSRAAARQNLRALARLQTIQFDSFLQEKKHLLRALSGEPKFSRLLDAYAREPKGETRRALRAILRLKIKRGKLRSLGLLDEKGRRFLTAGNSLSHRLHSGKAHTASHGAKIRILGILHFAKASETLLRMSVPFSVGAKSRFQLLADIPFSLHQRFLLEKKAPAFQGEIYLLDESRRIVCGSLDVKHLHSLSMQPKKMPFVPGEQVQRYRREDGSAAFGIALPLREVGWTILIELPEAKALQSLRQLKSRGLLALLGFCALLLVTIGFVSRQWVRPLRELLAATGAFGRGEFHPKLPSASDDEIGELTRAFEDLGKELRSYYTELEEKVAERTQELEQAQAFSDLLFHAIPEVILVTDQSLRVVKANRQAQDLFGEQVVGSYCFEVFEGEGATRDRCLAQEVLESGAPRSSEDQLPHPGNGELFYKDFYPIHDRQGEVIGVLESAKIITERKKLMAQVIQQEKIAALGLMASGVAHEIGNPLASIFALVQRLKRRAEGDLSDYVELEERCMLISRILEQLNDYARKKPERAMPLDLSREIEKAVALVSFDQRLRRVELEREILADLPLLWGREDALSQVMTNFLLNALDAVQEVEHPRIGIKAWPSRDGVFFQVWDNGHGIEEGQEEKLFEPFFTTKERAKGMGLGLAVSKQLVEDMGGRLEVRSREGEGALFEVYLPSHRGLAPEPIAQEEVHR